MRWLLLLSVLAACSPTSFTLQRQAQHDLDCEEIVFEERDEGRLVATGCARTAHYECRTEMDDWAGTETVCERQSEALVEAASPRQAPAVLAAEPEDTPGEAAEARIRQHLQARSAAARACLGVETLAIGATLEADGRVRFELLGAELRAPEAACVADVLGQLVVDGDAGSRVIHILR